MPRPISVNSAAQRAQDMAILLEEVVAALLSAQDCMETSSNDYSLNGRDAWLWGILLGWDDEKVEELATKFRWHPPHVRRLKCYHAAIAQLMGQTPAYKRGDICSMQSEPG